MQAVFTGAKKDFTPVLDMGKSVTDTSAYQPDVVAADLMFDESSMKTSWVMSCDSEDKRAVNQKSNVEAVNGEVGQVCGRSVGEGWETRE